MESATSATRSRFRDRAPGPAAPPRPPAARSRAGEVRARRTAGNAPKSSATSTTSPVAKRSVVPSTATWSRRGTSAGARARIRSTPKTDNPTPATPPTVARTRLSTRTCRASRPLDAPSAARTATSPVRVWARTRSRLATLAQTMSRTSPTAPRRIQRPAFTSATDSSARGTRLKPFPKLVSGNSSWRRWASASVSSRADPMPVPSARRPAASS